MRSVKVITDSTSDLTDEILQKYNITVVPLYVDFGEESYRDGVDIFPEQLFLKVQEEGILPKTASPSPYDFIKYFKESIDLGLDIIVITISSKMSSAYQNALLAASEFPTERILVVDSQNITTGIASLVMVAGDLAKQGKSVQEIAEKIRELTSRVRVNFVIDTLEYLYKGGRCNVVQNLLGTALKIRPIIGVDQGIMFVEGKTRGDKKRALDKMIDSFIERRDLIDFNRIFIVNSCGGEEELNYVKACFQEALPDIEIIMTKAGCVISSHCGEKTLGISYIEKEKNFSKS